MVMVDSQSRLGNIQIRAHSVGGEDEEVDVANDLVSTCCGSP